MKDITIRSATTADASSLLAIYAPYVEETAITFEYDVPTIEEFEHRIENTLKAYPYLVAEAEGRILGYAYASAFHPRAAYAWCIETSIYVDRELRKSGVGRKLHDALEAELRDRGILNMYACIAYPEVEDEHLTRNSAEFHAHLGYRMIGEFKQCGYKFDRWYGMVWMEKHIGEHTQGQFEEKENKTNIIEITDFNAPELDIYARISEVQLLNRAEPDKGIFIAESPKVIERALDAGCKPISILIERKHIEGEGRDIIARCRNIPVYTAEFDVLAQLTGFKLTRGMLCAMRRPKHLPVEQVIKGCRRIAILENIVNPTNIGAIFRSAAALNIDAVLLTPGCSDPLYRRAIRVSMGNVFQVPWTFFDDKVNWPDGIEYIKKAGFKTVAMALREDSVNIDDPALMAEDKLAIILGTEGDGLAGTTIADCDYTVMIPMSHGVDSLNVAAASAVAFWQLGNR